MVLAPLGLFGYLPALILWSVGGIAAYGASLRGLLPLRRWAVALVMAPATLICLLSGQTGLWAAALFIGGYRLKDKHPVAAGLLLGILTIKPQMGVLLALALSLTKRGKRLALRF